MHRIKEKAKARSGHSFSLATGLTVTDPLRYAPLMPLPILVVALLLGIVAGLRAAMPLAAVSWAASIGWLNLEATSLAFLGYRWTPWVLTAFALGELVTDKLPSTPSRTVPAAFATRLVTGALAGAAVAAPTDATLLGGIASVVGAVIGTLGGRAFRARLAAAFGRDLPAALIEDAIAIAVAVLAALGLS